MKNKNHYDVIIIGGGISGLMCAKHIGSKINIAILDKGRNFGGRMATRHFEGAVFDHGAQFFTAKSLEFQNYVNYWYQEKIIDIWFSEESNKKSKNHPRWFAKNGMNELARYIAKNINIYRSTEVSNVEFNDKYWNLKTLDGSEFSSDNIILTIPSPQIIKLLKNSNLSSINNLDIKQNLSVDYEKGIAILAVLDDESGIKKPGYLKEVDENIAWIADNYLKGISPIPSLTIHSSANYAKKYFDHTSKDQAHLILNLMKKIIKSNIVNYQVHKWGYTTPIIKKVNDTTLFEKYNLYFAGDSFSGPRIESAALSGLSIAEKILKKYQI